MIFKELDPFRGGEADVAARLVADRMAYYLRRYFRRSQEVDVLNDLRIPSGNAVAMLDHLLLHSHGLLLITREAGSGDISIDREGHWLRWDGGRAVDVGSPITRAYVQGLLLKSFLDRRVQQRGFFDRLELDVLVVVLDEVDITWPETGMLTEVCKREDVFERATRRIAHCHDSASAPGPLTPVERQLLGDFLCRSHLSAV
jgi:hypothetical protein